jgi:hypothetical protein
MFTNSDISIIKKSCIFTLEVIDLYNELVLTGKKPIAIRILSSTIDGTAALQKVLHSKTRREFIDSNKQAIINFKNVVYWIQQCEKSGYWFDENILRSAVEILEFCKSEEYVG